MAFRQPRVVELFSGAGLFSFAFRSVGFELTRAIELNALAAATYASNLGDHIEVGDVLKKRPHGRCEVLVAGPPCQGFSTLGRQDPDDPRNQLSLAISRWAAVLRPKVVVIENVPAFLSSPVWAVLHRRFKRQGFEVYTHVLDAYDFGVPQHRVRSFTIASKVGEILPVASAAVGARTVREAFQGLSRRPNGRNFHFAPTPSAIALARMRLIPPGGDKRDVMDRRPELAPKSWWKVGTSYVTDVWGRMKWSEPSNTLRTALQNPSKGRYIHPSEDRVISLREAARLQTIPDEWTFEGRPYPIARQIGNSVPPRLGQAVARAVMTRM